VDVEHGDARHRRAAGSANWFSPETGATAAKVSAASHANRCVIAAPLEKQVAKTRRGSTSICRPRCASKARV
jgi:hypothetical protein